MQYFVTNPKYQPHCTNISIDVWIDPPRPPPTLKRVSCPPGMLLRYFVNFYDMEIIEEEAFLAWKEDITQEFPGKGKALFQVPGRLAMSSLTSVCSGDSPHLTLPVSPPPPAPLRSTSGSPGWRRRRRRSRTTTQTEAAAAAFGSTTSGSHCRPSFLFLPVVGFLFSLHPLIIRKPAPDLTTSGAPRGCIPLRK